ncbi:uncharacterized protein LOC115350186 [Aquila chrysaetos chrysaetos]|uniref:uncharacterized protein LOC115350186 n=1 Tax=Aquila chrysaetos chrysaetos TaxID=223781 RepID=UPI0011765667|nr:uncharacterized protein LOC115350186 [Aquila chrysaetos chrysaetos]
MRPRGGARPCRLGSGYRTSEENYELFTSRKPIFLEYEGTSFIEWEFPDVCTAEDKRPICIPYLLWGQKAAAYIQLQKNSAFLQ